jgi:hypothetical protein
MSGLPLGLLRATRAPDIVFRHERGRRRTQTFYYGRFAQ